MIKYFTFLILFWLWYKIDRIQNRMMFVLVSFLLQFHWKHEYFLKSLNGCVHTYISWFLQCCIFNPRRLLIFLERTNLFWAKNLNSRHILKDFIPYVTVTVLFANNNLKMLIEKHCNIVCLRKLFCMRLQPEFYSALAVLSLYFLCQSRLAWTTDWPDWAAFLPLYTAKIHPTTVSTII